MTPWTVLDVTLPVGLGVDLLGHRDDRVDSRARAILWVTARPFLLSSSNILAVLGLRALFVVLASRLDGPRLMRFGAAAILLFASGKRLVARWVSMAPPVSLAVIFGLLGAPVAASMLGRGARPRAPVTSEGDR